MLVKVGLNMRLYMEKKFMQNKPDYYDLEHLVFEKPKIKLDQNSPEDKLQTRRKLANKYRSEAKIKVKNGIDETI